MSLKALSPSYYSRIHEVSLRVPEQKRILDAGCSDGYFCFLNQHKGEIHGVDLNPGDVKLAQMRNSKGKFIVAALDSLPYPKEYFDVIISIDVLEHIKDDDSALAELSRVIKEDGKVIITVPQAHFPFTYDPLNYLLKFFKMKLRVGMWGYGHQRLYTLSMLEALLQKHNLEIIEVKYISHWLLGIVDNCYLNSLIQPLVKSDPKNLAETKVDLKKLKERLMVEPPKFLRAIRDALIKIDARLFRSSKSSLEILIVAKKELHKNKK